MSVEWKSGGYGVHLASVAPALTIVVSLSSDRAKPGYRVTVFGEVLRGMSPDVVRGKERAELHAKKGLLEALQRLR